MKLSNQAVLILSVSVASTNAFLTPFGNTQPLNSRHGGYLHQSRTGGSTSQYPRDLSVGLFRDMFKKITNRDKSGEDDDENENSKVESLSSPVEDAKITLDSSQSSDEEKMEKLLPFFAASDASSSGGDDTVNADVATAAEETTVQSTAEDFKPETVTAPITPSTDTSTTETPKKEGVSPQSEAEKLRAQAARIRLEAEKRTVELTLEKMDKLNKKLEQMKAHGTVNDKDQKELEEELQRLKSQLIPDDKGKAQTVKPVVSESTVGSTNTVDTRVTTRPSLSSEEVQDRVEKFKEAPEFLRILVAKVAGFGVDENTPGAVDRLNATDIISQLYQDEAEMDSMTRVSSGGIGYDKLETENARALLERAYKKSKGIEDMDEPMFTEAQLQAKVKELEELPQFLKDVASDGRNDTEIAIDLLTDEWQRAKKKGDKKAGFFSLFGGEDKGEIGRDGERLDVEDRGTFSRLFTDDEISSKEQSDLTLMMESQYPKSTRKEDETPSKKLVDAFLNDVVTPTKAFTPSDNPVSVPGGWIIRGTNNCKSGDELIEKLDRRVATDNRLREKISFSFVKDPFPNADQILDPLNWPVVLFVTGADVARDPRLVVGTLISATGIATAWYASIYPFLANSKLLDRATEAMELSDAGMPVDLSWLSEKSIPLFLTFMALQVTHELAHRAVAQSKDFEISIPTVVPSILTGFTSTITSLKTQPKNKQDLLDFAMAGPLAGMVLSIGVLVYGLILTATADPDSLQSFPGLPLFLLRQSSLGGGIVDGILGNGVLNVPMSAEGAQSLATTLISLHPFAVAGFVSLIVNALALVPIGRTDGGRVSLALFGRSGSQAVAFASLVALAILGFTGSDVFLFYFAFVTFFQSELEIPMRNEVDDVDFSRVVLATFAGLLMLLTLIPM
ncbi:predicted protein [Thalassiosira pseudonana CCMP1335]|uniref:Peptidase M50 domain-containing protein n=1 Tax=Thalassiosira pseudonana TaxID=35128 RepID=B8BRH0_THAPS|nr:predicted protein [Thalassiosira pseudonana CCMP1335]EED95954.1 predicted protein [Thalassiosira pseudonana CCMP1335]